MIKVISVYSENVLETRTNANPLLCKEDAMSLFNITYTLNKTVLHKEGIFMYSLSNAKCSATSQAPEKPVIITITDIMDKRLAVRKDGRWQ